MNPDKKINYSTYSAHFFGGLVFIVIGIKEAIQKKTNTYFWGEVTGEVFFYTGIEFALIGLLLVSFPFVFRNKRKDSQLGLDALVLFAVYVILTYVPAYLLR